MIEERGEVVRVEGSQAWVETQRRSACDHCGSTDSCGTGTLSKVLGRRSNLIRVSDALGCGPGDRVVLGVDEAALLRSSFVVYGVPLIMMMLGAVVGRGSLAGMAGLTPDTGAMMAGLFGLMAGFWWARGFSGRVAGDSRYQPVILRRVGEAAAVHHVAAPDIQR